MSFDLGLHRHFKGGLYSAIAIVKHHETREPWVLYISHQNGTMNIRPLVDVKCGWAGLVEYGGKQVQRFQFIRDMSHDESFDEAALHRLIGERRG